MRSNWIVPTNATFTCCDVVSNLVMNTTCCDGAEDAFPRARTQINVVGLTVFSLVITGLCLMGLLNARARENREILALQAQAVENAASQESKEERKIKRKEFILNGLRVKEWALDGAPVVESTEGDQNTPLSGEAAESRQPPALPVSASSASCVGSNDCEDQNTPPSAEAVEAPQPLSPPINSFSPASCAMGSDDCDSLAGDDEMAGCAICLSPFKPQQLVCESDNPSCRHIFHKDCMVDWLMKLHDDCPMCREAYLLQATV
jgi:hypothetical protein